MTFTARIRFSNSDGLSRAMLAAARPTFRATAEAAGQQAMANIVAAAPKGSPSGKRSTPLSDGSNYNYGVSTIPRGVKLEIFLVNGDQNWLIKFWATNRGRRGRGFLAKTKPEVFVFTGRPGVGRGRGWRGKQFTQSVSEDGGVAGTGWFDDAVNEALAQHHLT